MYGRWLQKWGSRVCYSGPRGLRVRYSTQGDTNGQSVTNDQSSQSVTGSVAKCQSVTETEVSKFARISDSWWDPRGPFKYLHTMNAPRIQFIRSRILDLQRSHNSRLSDLNKLRAVDVGCGGGLASESLARLGMHVVGVDAAEENISMAREHQQRDPMLVNLEYRHATAEQLVEQREEFDVVVSLEVIEHVTSAFEFVRSLVRLARPGGLVVVSTMNRTVVSWLVDVVVPEYVMGSVPRGTHDVAKFVPPHELREMLDACGAETVDVQGLVLDPIRNVCNLVPRDFGLVRNVGVQANYILAARKKL
ncbi:Hexaprenyldihydroxybenzoate methyltransferase, mitochondrial [Coemansia sp. RSA 2131]|nr:Hexaprenyldihydroxybenzoate methyltransferase, mitochondrial [Coemansia sp. RSA 2131]